MSVMDEIRQIAKAYGVRVYKSRREYGYANCTTGTIHIKHYPKNRTKTLGTFFHELAHIICTVEGKYINYHLDLKDDSHLKRIVVRAERYVDKRGRELMGQWYPELPYVLSYKTKEDIEWLKKYWSID